LIPEKMRGENNASSEIGNSIGRFSMRHRTSWGFAQLGQTVYGSGRLTERISELSRLMRPVAGGDFDSAVAQLQRTIQERRKFVVSGN
jgi:hypothetical protein